MKNIVLGVAAFGGLLLVASLFWGDSETPAGAPEEPAVTNTTIPATFADFPVYPDATVVRVTDSMSASGEQHLTVSLTTTDDLEKIYDWYEAALGTDGWGITNDQTVAGYRILQGEHANLYTSLQVSRNNETGEGTISQQMKLRLGE